MHGMYNYAQETNCISRVHHNAAILGLQSMVHAVLFPMMYVLCLYIVTFLIICAEPSMAVFRSTDLRAFYVPVFPQYFNET